MLDLAEAEEGEVQEPEEGDGERRDQGAGAEDRGERGLAEGGGDGEGVGEREGEREGEGGGEGGGAAGGEEAGAADRLGEQEVELARLERADVDADQVEGADGEDEEVLREVVVDEDQVGARAQAQRVAEEALRELGEARHEQGVDGGDPGAEGEHGEVTGTEPAAELGDDEGAHASILRTARTPRPSVTAWSASRTASGRRARPGRRSPRCPRSQTAW